MPVLLLFLPPRLLWPPKAGTERLVFIPRGTKPVVERPANLRLPFPLRLLLPPIFDDPMLDLPGSCCIDWWPVPLFVKSLFFNWSAAVPPPRMFASGSRGPPTALGPGFKSSVFMVNLDSCFRNRSERRVEALYNGQTQHVLCLNCCGCWYAKFELKNWCCCTLETSGYFFSSVDSICEHLDDVDSTWSSVDMAFSPQKIVHNG